MDQRRQAAAPEARGAAQDRETWLNGRDYQWMIDPDANLAAQEQSLLSASSIVPLTEPLRGPGAREYAASKKVE